MKIEEEERSEMNYQIYMMISECLYKKDQCDLALAYLDKA